MAGEINTISPSQTTQSQPLHDRVAIVTGGSGGIGKAISRHLASLGANLVINDNTTTNESDLLVSEINSKYPSQSQLPRAVSIKGDISDPVQVKKLFDAAESAFDSPLYILVNVAGILNSAHSLIQDSSLEAFDRTFAVNTRGAYLCCKEAANRLKQGGGGRIICLTSSLVVDAKPGFGAYTASKAAVEAMVKILAKELKGTRITANCIAPGPIVTNMLEGISEVMLNMLADTCPFGRLGEPEDVAPVIGFLVSDAGEWVNGQIVRVNGGYV